MDNSAPQPALIHLLTFPGCNTLKVSPAADDSESLFPFTGLIIVLGIGVVLIAFLISLLIICGCRKRRKESVEVLPKESVVEVFQSILNNAVLVTMPPTHRGGGSEQTFGLSSHHSNLAPPLPTHDALPFTHKGTTNATVVTLSPLSNTIQVMEVDASTMERFIQDMAREKPVRFTGEQISTFTNNYSKRLGSGGFGVVYEGVFPDGVRIAVKVLKGPDERVEEQFMAEVGTIGRTHHINLVRLYGFCFDNTMSALVYEYMENGSLDNFLFTNTSMIEFNTLHGIAVGTAKGLAYLHEECLQRIVHYDIKPGNILLDSNFSPKVADFGLAKLRNRDNTHDSVTGYRGTPGYMAPEFSLKNNAVTYKCDVYSFGMLLFEIVRRRRNANANPIDSLDWFPEEVWKGYKKGGLMELTVNCGIEGEDRVRAERMLLVGLWCIQDSPEARPLMSDVVRMLEGGVEILPPPKPFQYLSVLSSRRGTSSSYSFSQYTDATPIIKKYEINRAR